MITSGQRHYQGSPEVVRKPVLTLLIRILIPLMGVALLASCGSSGNNSSAGQSTSAAASPSFDQAAATTQVKQVWQSFFAKDTPISQKEALLQNGTTTMMPVVQAFANDPRVGQVTATVQNVSFPSPTEADVSYTISLNGQVMESGMAGKAVNVGGHWLVSDVTLCGLLQLAAAASGGSAAAIPGCS